jgi:hypothetical protein
MNKTYDRLFWLWILAFSLKVAGATADVSWHFMYLRERFAIPHVVNLVGDGLAFGLLIYQLLTRRYIEKSGFRLTWVGMVLFLVAAPFDDWWHRTFGLDLTSWSPPHYLLYTGTALMILGCMRMLLGARDRISARAFLPMMALLSLFLVEDVVFPLGQQEYGAVVLWLVEQGRWVASPDLMALVKDPWYHAYGMLPPWLYPVYLVSGYAFALGIARAMTGHAWGATIGSGLYFAYRWIARFLLGAIGLPVSFIPLFVIGIAVIIDLMARVADWRIRIPALAALATGYTWLCGWIAHGRIAYLPLWPMDSWPLALGAALFGVALATGVSAWLARPVKARKPASLAA